MNLSECEKFRAIIDNLRAGTKEIWVHGLWDSSRVFFLSATLGELHVPGVVVGYRDEETEQVYQELMTFLPDLEIQLFPSREICQSRQKAIQTSAQIAILSRLLSGKTPTKFSEPRHSPIFTGRGGNDRKRDSLNSHDENCDCP